VCHDLPVILNFRRSLQKISHIRLILLGYRMRSMFSGKKVPYFAPTCLVLKWLIWGLQMIVLLTSPLSVAAFVMDPHCPVFSAACRLYPLFTFIYPYQHRNFRLLFSSLFLQKWRQTDCNTYRSGVLIAGTEVQLQLEIENIGSFMLFTKYKTATFLLPWVWNVWLNMKVYCVCVCICICSCAAFCSLLLGVSGAEI
jgi:hypothetical protein